MESFVNEKVSITSSFNGIKKTLLSLKTDELREVVIDTINQNDFSLPLNSSQMPGAMEDHVYIIHDCKRYLTDDLDPHNRARYMT